MTMMIDSSSLNSADRTQEMIDKQDTTSLLTGGQQVANSEGQQLNLGGGTIANIEARVSEEREEEEEDYKYDEDSEEEDEESHYAKPLGKKRNK